MNRGESEVWYDQPRTNPQDPSYPNWCPYDVDDLYITDSGDVVWLNWDYLEYEAGPGGTGEENYQYLIETRLEEFSKPVLAGPYESRIQGPLEAPKPWAEPKYPW